MPQFPSLHAENKTVLHHIGHLRLSKYLCRVFLDKKLYESTSIININESSLLKRCGRCFGVFGTLSLESSNVDWPKQLGISFQMLILTNVALFFGLYPAMCSLSVVYNWAKTPHPSLNYEFSN